MTSLNPTKNPRTSRRGLLGNGVRLAAGTGALATAGVETTQTVYPGVTHEFFGMGTVIDVAMQAEMDVTQGLMTAFGGGGGMVTPMASPTS